MNGDIGFRIAVEIEHIDRIEKSFIKASEGDIEHGNKSLTACDELIAGSDRNLFDQIICRDRAVRAEIGIERTVSIKFLNGVC